MASKLQQPIDQNSVNLPLLICERDNFIFLTGLVPADSEVPNDPEIDFTQRSMKTFFLVGRMFSRVNSDTLRFNVVQVSDLFAEY